MADVKEPNFGLGKSLLFSGVLIFFFLGAAELAVRGYAYFLREDVERFDLATQTFVLVPGKHRSAMGTVVVNSDGFVGRELERDGPDLWRIAAVGDSCTYGAGNETDTYPAQLDARLNERERPGLRYEVVNAGISGLNSELALARLRTKVLPLHPDVVTIYIGWNDLMKVDPFAGGSSAHWSGVARFLDRLWLVKGLRKLIFYHIRPYLRPPATGPESHTGRLAEFRPTLYEGTLREMIAAVRKSGSRPVLVTLPTPVRPSMTLDDIRKTNVYFPYFPAAYGVLDLLDLINDYNSAIRRVAVEQDVPLIDLAHEFQQFDEPASLFFDTMHTNPEGAKRIADVLLRDLDRDGLLDPAAAPPAGTAAR